MATIKDIKESKLKIWNPDALYVTPFITETSAEGKPVLKKGSNTYKLDEVIRDTTTISQDDPTSSVVENEFGSAPILDNISLGSYQFSAEVADMQQELLTALCGYVTKTGKADRTYAPSTYTPIYAEIALAFKYGTAADGTAVYAAAVLPKVQLNSKATFDSLSSSMGRITLAGTGMNITVDDIETPFYIDTNFSVSTDI